MNAVIIYRHNGGWAFDDERLGLLAEALIEGADTLVDRVLATQRPACDGLSTADTKSALLRFSDGNARSLSRAFLGHVGPWIFLKKVGESNGGTDYEVDDPMRVAGHRVWFGPALLCYFAVAPRSITLDLYPLPSVATAESSLICSRALAARPSPPPSQTPV